MNTVLVVKENFLDHRKGEMISDPKKVEEYTNSEWQNHFVKTSVPVDPAPGKRKPA